MDDLFEMRRADFLFTFRYKDPIGAAGHVFMRLRVARTIADLNGSEQIRPRDVGSALALRSEAQYAGSRAA